ncbi:hypothetical protein [Pseudoalteromonas 'SMAR']|uniref:hypothetical protein n=1 Tax=Pseudoalteromonas 'SMAR' TaxID=3416908 RepID=UPI003AF20684
MLLFTAIIILYISTCISLFKLYFFLQKKNQQSSSAISVIASYLLFACFIIIAVPFAIFFPAWINVKLGAISGPESSTMLILFGCVVLAMSIWQGRKSRPTHF